MATINYKEKYEKAVHAAMLAKQDTESAVTIRTLEEIFPELKESEGERIRKRLINAFEEFLRQNDYDKETNFKGVNIKDAIAWLEKQGETSYILSNSSNIGKDEQKPTWSEEDERHIDTITSLLEDRKKEQSDFGVEVLNKEIAWLKSLKDRVQPQQEWGEDDATHYNRILKELNLQKEMPINASVIEEVKSDIIWLKSLRPQNRWKPSEEQTEILDMVLSNESMDDNVARILRELREQLKKL